MSSMLIEIINGLGSIVLGLIDIYIWIVIITALLSFVNPDPYNPIIQFLYRVTNPAYRLTRKYIKTNFNGLDLAPMIIVVVLQIIVVVLRSLLHAL